MSHLTQTVNRALHSGYTNIRLVPDINGVYKLYGTSKWTQLGETWLGYFYPNNEEFPF